MSAARRNRYDETWHRLRDWTGGATKSEMLAWQVIDAAGYSKIDPAHPHGGPDGGGDAKCERDGEVWVMAAYFPLGQKPPATTKRKLQHDINGAKAKGARGIAFVTNQEVTLADRESWESLDPDLDVDIFHLLRVTEMLNKPEYAQTREEFLDIVAGPPPMLIDATVIGTARMFVEDSEVFERFVSIHADRTRKRSEAGHARVRAEREEREREAAARPWDITLGVRNALADSGVLNSIMGQYDPVRSLINIPGLTEPPPSEPMSEDQIAEEVAEYRIALEARWSSCMEYLAGIAWEGLKFRIKNLAKSFLSDVQVIITFHGARGVDWLDQDDFVLAKVQDPEYEPPRNPLYFSALPMPPLAPIADTPIEWRHDDNGDLEVTITLHQLRPHPEWRSDDYGDEIVLIVNPKDQGSAEVTFSYTVTAQGYGEVFEGGPTVVDVEKLEMLDVLRGVMDATREAEDES